MRIEPRRVGSKWLSQTSISVNLFVFSPLTATLPSKCLVSMKPARRPRSFRPATLILCFSVGITFIYFFLFVHTTHHRRLNTGIPLSKTIKRFNLNAVTATASAAQNKERILILSPLAKFYDEYWTNLLQLTYPRELLDLAFIIPRGQGTQPLMQKLESAIDAVQSTRRKFGSITVLRQDFDSPVGQKESERHALSAQKERRSALATARNSLLFSALRPETSWVLHLDSDIVETPKTLLEDLTAQNKDIIVPNCFQRYEQDGETLVRPYDYNSWHESQVALDMAAKMQPDEIILEGYAELATYRSLMAYEYQPGGDGMRTVQIDGVGGTALLVKAAVHRDGAMFPNFPFYHMLETEGFAKMAARLGYQCWGMPDYLVYHYNE